MKVVIPFIIFLAVTISLSAQKTADKKVVFYIVRHGETLLNRLNRVQGWADAPLTEKGKTITQALALGLKQIPFAAVYSSDLGRAKETAGDILKTQSKPLPPYSETAALRESCFGSYEGSENKKMWTDAALYLHYTSAEALFADMQKTDKLPEVLAAVKTLDTLKIAEDFNDVAARMKEWLIKTAGAAGKGGNILVVSHGIAINALLSAIATGPFAHKPLGNASVTKLEFDNGKFTILAVGDMQYVEAGLKLKE